MHPIFYIAIAWFIFLVVRAIIGMVDAYHYNKEFDRKMDEILGRK